MLYAVITRKLNKQLRNLVSGQSPISGRKSNDSDEVNDKIVAASRKPIAVNSDGYLVAINNRSDGRKIPTPVVPTIFERLGGTEDERIVRIDNHQLIGSKLETVNRITTKLRGSKFIRIAIIHIIGLIEEDVLCSGSDKSIAAFMPFQNIRIAHRLDHFVLTLSAEKLFHARSDVAIHVAVGTGGVNAIHQIRFRTSEKDVALTRVNTGTRRVHISTNKISSVTTNKDIGTNAALDKVISSAAIYGSNLGTSLQEIILFSRREGEAKLSQSGGVSESIDRIVNVKHIGKGSTESLGGRSCRNGDFSLSFSLIPFSSHQGDVTVGLAIKVVPFQLSRDDIGGGFAIFGRTLGAERNRGVDSFGTVDQPVGTGNGIGKGIGYGILATLGTGQHNRARVGKATVDAGAGDDTITASAEGGTFTGGAGEDTFDVSAAVLKNVSSIDTMVISTITDFGADDTLTMIGTATAITELKLDATVQNLLGALTLAAATENTTVWFQYAGDTYIVANDGTGGLGTGDLAVKLTGTGYDFDGATLNAGELSLA